MKNLENLLSNICKLIYDSRTRSINLRHRWALERTTAAMRADPLRSTGRCLAQLHWNRRDRRGRKYPGKEQLQSKFASRQYRYIYLRERLSTCWFPTDTLFSYRTVRSCRTHLHRYIINLLSIMIMIMRNRITLSLSLSLSLPLSLSLSLFQKNHGQL